MNIVIELNKEYIQLAEKFVKFLCKELCIIPRNILIANCDIDGNNGMCIDKSEGSYMILVKQTDRNIGQIFTTIAHEMIHVKQYMTQDLGTLLDEYKTVPYLDRWWEQEAFDNSVSFVEKFSKQV
jgi:uncharacterized protein YjaZ